MGDSNLATSIDEQLRLQTLTTKTASFNSTAIQLTAGFAPAGAGQPMRIFYRVAAIDTTDGDEAYTLKVQDSPDGVTFTDRSEARVVTTADVGAIIAGIRNVYVRLVLTVSGTTPSITYEAWLSPWPR